MLIKVFNNFQAFFFLVLWFDFAFRPFFQVEKFIKEDVEPILQSYKNFLQGTAEVHV